jgi:hypothetical protein
MAEGDQRPIDARVSFDEIGEGFDSRITLLLILGAMYGTGRGAILQDIAEHRDEFPVPIYQPGSRLEAIPSVFALRERGIDPALIRNLSDPERPEVTGIRRRRVADLVRELYEQPKPETAGEILLLGLGDPDELIRAAAAISFLDLFDEISLAVTALLSIIEDGSNELARELAELVIRKLGTTAPIVPLNPRDDAVRSEGNLATTVLIHGTHFGFVGTPIADWWKPRGDFHSFIKGSFRPNLYAKPDFFTWSGGFSDHARQLAAIELRDWSRNRGFSEFDVIAHSHGGNVAMWATQLGVSLNNLVLLSCPAHPRRYLPEFTRVKQVVSYQIKLDWVILADGGATKFNHPRISDRILPRWFRHHEDTRKPSFWQQFGILI